MSTANCVVSRSFRGSVLFLVAEVFHGFNWSADRAQAARFDSDAALAIVKRFEAWSRGDPGAGSCQVIDPKGHAITSGGGSGSVPVPVRKTRAEMEGEGRAATSSISLGDSIDYRAMLAHHTVVRMQRRTPAACVRREDREGMTLRELIESNGVVVSPVAMSYSVRMTALFPR